MTSPSNEQVSTLAKAAIEQLLSIHALACMARASGNIEYLKSAGEWLPQLERTIKFLRSGLAGTDDLIADRCAMATVEMKPCVPMASNLKRCLVCGFVIDANYEAEKPTVQSRIGVGHAK